jgi:hypothetical protein
MSNIGNSEKYLKAHISIEINICTKEKTMIQQLGSPALDRKYPASTPAQQRSPLLFPHQTKTAVHDHYLLHSHISSGPSTCKGPRGPMVSDNQWISRILVTYLPPRLRDYRRYRVSIIDG